MSWDFTYLFTEILFYKVLFGVSLIGALSGVVGTFSLLRKKSLISDAISHSVLPGICVGFIYEGSKNPLVLLIGCLIAGLISVWLIDFIVRRTKLSEDTAIAFASTFFFALGSVLLSYIVAGDNPEKVGLKDYLFGKAATISFEDINIFMYCGVAILVLIVAFYKQIKLVVFNVDFAASIGISIRLIEFMIAVITVLTVAIGIQAVGVVLMSALIIAPSAAARYWTNNLVKVLLLAALFGCLASSLGVFTSGIFEDMPTGPWVVTYLFLFVFFTLLFAPRKGWFSVLKRKRKTKGRIERENVLKTFFQLEESGVDNVRIQDLMQRRYFESSVLGKILNSLQKDDLLQKENNVYHLTVEGKTESSRIVRLHRLWELYLTKRMNFKEDHIHGSAESVEHLITPELEQELLRDLDFPESDPHNKNIPY